MLLPAKLNRKNSRGIRKPAIFQKKNRKGLSIVIGYVLLISISLIMSALVFMWLRTYVPKDIVECPEDTSVLIKDISYNCTDKTLKVTLENNGKFSINGYFIHALNITPVTNEEIATADLSSKLMSGGVIAGNAITFSLDKNSLTPNEPTNSKTCTFNVSRYGTLYKLEIIPTRYQEENEKNVFVSCGNAKVEETLTCIA